MQVVGQVGGAQRGARGDHAAADVDPDRGRDDRAHGGDHAANGRPFAQMHIGHDRQVFEDERHLRGVDQLLPGFALDRDALGPQLDRLAVTHFQQLPGRGLHDCGSIGIGRT
ncbi:hypothetical protein D3C87_1745640 [compost metagenome]